MGVDPVTLGLGMTIASGVMGIAQGFAQAGTVTRQAAMQQQAAKNNYYSQAAAVTQLESEQAQAETAATSTRMAAAQRNLGTLQAVMGERGVAGATFTGLLNDLSNSESVDLTRIGTNYGNQIASDQSRITAAGQDYVNQDQDARFKASAADTSAWLNTIGTTLKVGGQYAGQQIEIAGTERRFNALLDKVGKGYSVNPYAGS